MLADDTAMNNIPSNVESYLAEMKWRLSRVAAGWSSEDYRKYIRFFSSIIPGLLGAERCTVFVVELGEKSIYSVYGTGLEQRLAPPVKGSIVGEVMRSGRSRLINDLSGEDDYRASVEEQTGYTSYNMVCVPIKSLTGKEVSGAIQLLNKLHGAPFTGEDLAMLEEIAHFLSFSIEAIVLTREVSRLAEALEEEVDMMRPDPDSGLTIIAESQAMREVLELVRVVSRSPVNVLVHGENGTGKELVARMIHQNGRRKNGPFLPVNCAAIPENLMESHFFGHEKGAFTGADMSRPGLFEEASGGTLFLDEIGEMPISVQPKVLRAIQEGEGQRLGSNAIRKYDLRLVSATNRDLSVEIKRGRFREDLFFRLFSVDIYLPPLRDRKEDILPLSHYFLRLTNERFEKNVFGFAPEVLLLFEEFGWPGNIRQLQKEIERLVALTENGEIIQPEQLSRDLYSIYMTLPPHAANMENGGELDLPSQVQRLEVILIRKALRQCGANKTKAARLLNISRQGLDKKMKRFGL
jgi:transcriptional regulator with GAF, ATPase, and Fis domain